MAFRMVSLLWGAPSPWQALTAATRPQPEVDPPAHARDVRKGISDDSAQQHTRAREQEARNALLHANLAAFVSNVTGEPIRPHALAADLVDGVAFRKLALAMDPDVLDTPPPAAAAHSQQQQQRQSSASRENFELFATACRNAGIPVDLAYADVEAGDNAKTATVLVFVAHAAATRGVGTEFMGTELQSRVESLSILIESMHFTALGAAAVPEHAMRTPPPSPSLARFPGAPLGGDDFMYSDASGASSLPEMAWWRALLVRCGLGDFKDVDLTKLRAYAAKNPHG